MKPYHESDGVTIYHGEAFEVLAALEPGSVDAVVTDPPYSSGGQYRGDRSKDTREKYAVTSHVKRGAREHGERVWQGKKYALFEGDNRDGRSFGYWATLWLSAAYRATRPGGLCLMFADWRQLPTATDVLQAGGWTWRGIVVWNKGGGARPMKGRFTPQAEFVVWGSRGAMDTPGAPGVMSECLPGQFDVRACPACGHVDDEDGAPILSHGVNPREKLHQTGKPLPLMRDLLRIVLPGSTVLDPFMGSGTTLVAAREMGCPVIGCEVVEHYCGVTVERLRQGTLFS